MYKLYVVCLIWVGIFKRLPTPKRRAMLKRCGYPVIDNTEVKALLKTAMQKENERGLS